MGEGRSGSQGLVAIFLLFIIFHIMYDYTIIYSIIIYNMKKLTKRNIASSPYEVGRHAYDVAAYIAALP